MYTIKGRIKYFNAWCLAYIDQQLVDYYRSLVPKYYRIQSQREKAHVTIVREFEELANKQHWGKYDGHVILIDYSPIIQYDDVYFWLDCWCNTIGNIREELGLPRYRLEYPGKYHITIGNTK